MSHKQKTVEKVFFLFLAKLEPVRFLFIQLFEIKFFVSYETYRTEPKED